MPRPLATSDQIGRARRPHYIAATFYLVVAIAGVVTAITGTPAALIVTVLAGLYSVYLYRGGRVVIWFW